MDYFWMDILLWANQLLTRGHHSEGQGTIYPI